MRKYSYLKSSPIPSPSPIKWGKGVITIPPLHRMGRGLGGGDITQKMCILSFIVLLLLTACAQIAPAQLPDRLQGQNNHLPTLSAPFIITNQHYTNSAFSVNYPQGWRVVSSASFAPPSAVFVSPDEKQIVLISTETEATLTYPFADIPHDQISQQVGDIWVIGVAPIDEWESFLITYEAMLTALDN